MHRVLGERDLSTVDSDLARTLLDGMVRARVFDDRAFALQRQGWMSGYPPFRGQEASQIGAATAMADDDWLVPTYRSNAMQLARGVPMADILRFRRGYPEFGSDHDLPALPQAVPIASQIPHAVGIGMAVNYRDTEEAAVCYFGDGATSEGDFHEGLNFAGVFDVPVVFLCENNGWAISTPESAQTASNSIAQKADAYGIEGVRVDGNDPLATYEVLTEALSLAREGRPVLVESFTYRQGPHTTSDDPERYEDRESFPEWRTVDPIERFEEALREVDIVSEAFLADSQSAATEAFDAAKRAAETADSNREAVELFESVYGSIPSLLERQREELDGWVHRHGDPYEGE
jgi:pyruvate dehydrogenase E1 component alpha subunit